MCKRFFGSLGFEIGDPVAELFFGQAEAVDVSETSHSRLWFVEIV